MWFAFFSNPFKFIRVSRVFVTGVFLTWLSLIYCQWGARVCPQGVAGVCILLSLPCDVMTGSQGYAANRRPPTSLSPFRLAAVRDVRCASERVSRGGSRQKLADRSRSRTCRSSSHPNPVDQRRPIDWKGILLRPSDGLLNGWIPARLSLVMMLGLLREQQLRLCCHGQHQCQQLSAVWATGVVHFIRRLCRSTSLHGATVSDSYRSLCHLPYNHFISCARAEWDPYSERYNLSVGIPANPLPPMCGKLH